MFETDDDDADADDAVPPPIRRSSKVDQVYKPLNYFDIQDSDTEDDHPLQQRRAASVGLTSLTAFVTPPLPKKTPLPPRRNSALTPEVDVSNRLPDHEQPHLPDELLSNIIGNRPTVRPRTLSCPVPGRVAPKLPSTNIPNPRPIPSPVQSPSDRDNALPDQSLAKPLPRQTPMNSPNRSNSTQQSPSRSLSNLRNRALLKPLPIPAPKLAPYRRPSKSNPYLRPYRLPISLRRCSSLETIDSVTTTPTILDQDSQDEAEDARQQNGDDSNTSTSDEDIVINEYLAGLANSPHNTRVPSEVYNLSHKSHLPPQVNVPIRPHSPNVYKPTTRDPSPQPECTISQESPHTKPAPQPEWPISKQPPHPKPRLSPRRLILDVDDFSSDEESSFPSSPSYQHHGHPHPISRSPPRKPRPSSQITTSHSNIIDSHSSTSSPSPSFSLDPTPSSSASRPISPPSSSLFRKLKHTTSRSSNRPSIRTKMKEPLLDPPLHLEINKCVEIDPSSISYRPDSSDSIMTISSGLPENLLCVPRPTSSASGDSGASPSQASVGGSTKSASEWKASNFDTSSLSEAELKKCRKKGINPSLYAEMKAARKGKFVSPIGGNTFL